MSIGQTAGSQRAWARVAGAMYWLVLVADMTGMQVHRGSLRSWLMLAGSVLTVPLALGLYYAVRPVQPRVAGAALGLRLLEATLGCLSVAVGFPAVQAAISGTSSGEVLLRLARWDDATALGAFVFTLGSTLFFALFVRSGYIPRVLAWWGLFASVVALGACSIHLVRPDFPAMTMGAWIPALLAETSTGLWLLIRSVDVGDRGYRRGALRFAKA